MTKYITILLCFALISHSITSTGKCSLACQKAKKYNCYEPARCSIDRYLLNPDFFTLYVKNDVKYSKYTFSDYQDELIEIKEENTTPWGTFISSLQHYKESSVDIEQIQQSKEIEIISEFGPAFRRYRTENYSSNRETSETYETFEGSDYSMSVVRDPLAVVGVDLTSDIGVCARYFKENFNDKMRDLALYPYQCTAQCLVNYQVLYSVWSKIAKVLAKLIHKKLKGVTNCRKRQSLLKRWLRDACRPYSPAMYRIFKNYLDFIFIKRVCDREWYAY